MVLFINACIRAGHSRTLRLANVLLQQLYEPYTEIVLADIAFQPVDYSYIQTRDLLLSEGDYTNPMFDLARQFATADTIVIAAPYWDWNCQEMCSHRIPKIMDRQESGCVMSQPG